MHLTGTRLLEVCNALNVLKTKRLPSLDADLLVAGMWTGLKNPREEYDEVAKKLNTELQEAGEDKDARRAVLKKFEELGERKFEVTPPKAKLTKEHLPKPYKGEAGEMNTAGNAGVITGLGDEFFQFDQSE